MASMQRRGENSWFFVMNVGYRPDGTRAANLKQLRFKSCHTHILAMNCQIQNGSESGEYINLEKITFSSFVEIWTRLNPPHYGLYG
ncbi:hypothetical protein D3C76_364000 [compost metagenome]